MKIKIYQINPDKDANRVKYLPLKRVKEVDSSIYELVFDGSLPAKSLEDVFYILNTQIPEGFSGHSLSPSDVVVVENCDFIQAAAYYCESYGWKKLNNFN